MGISIRTSKPPYKLRLLHTALAVFAVPVIWLGWIIISGLELLNDAGNGDTIAVYRLLHLGADVNTYDADTGMSALTIAAQNGHKDTVKALLDGGADVNRKDEYHRTALMLASSNGFPDIVMLLISRGANVNMEDRGGETALSRAEQYKYMNIIRQLKVAGAVK